jgi:hypothetical protein
MQQWDGEKNIDIRVFHLIIEHLVTAEYDFFVMLILTQLFCNTSGQRALIKHGQTQITHQEDQKGFQENNKWATQGKSETAELDRTAIKSHKLQS